MDTRTDNSFSGTYFAPAERASREELLTAREAVLAQPLLIALLDAVPDLAMVLNAQRQIIAVNTAVLQALGVADPEMVLGLRPGEATGCIHADEHPGGCGTAEECANCGAVNAILACQRTRGLVAHETRISTVGAREGGALDLLVQASPLSLDGEDYIIVVLRDISPEKRRQVLERVFFHDVLNTAGTIYGMSDLLLDEKDPARAHEYQKTVHRLSRRIIEEISAHRELLAAERGDLEIDLVNIPLPELLEEVVTDYRSHPVSQQRTLHLGTVPSCTLTTDVTLLRRILGNLVKNALEATPRGGTVTISAERSAAEIVMTVHNPGAMSTAVRQQIFQRSFSTKEGHGRGIGTYSIKLFTERYLGGRVTFTSSEEAGTIFTVALPTSL